MKFSGEVLLHIRFNDIAEFAFFPNFIFQFFFGFVFVHPGQNFFEIRRYFSKIADNSADTAVNFRRTADAPLS